MRPIWATLARRASRPGGTLLPLPSGRKSISPPKMPCAACKTSCDIKRLGEILRTGRQRNLMMPKGGRQGNWQRNSVAGRSTLVFASYTHMIIAIMSSPLYLEASRAFSRRRSALVVLVVAAPPDARLVAPLGRAVEPLVHAPEAVQSARISGIDVVDDAVLAHERAHARPLARVCGYVGSGHGCVLGNRFLAAFRQ